MINLKDKLKNSCNWIKENPKIAIPTLAFTGFLGLNYILADVEAKIINKNQGKIMPQIQPWISVYDDNDDGKPDRTQVKMLGGPAGQYRVIFDRKPTQEEINFYKEMKK